MFKITSLNVHGLLTPAKRDLVLNELSRSDFDLFLLQETHVSCKDQADVISARWPG